MARAAEATGLHRFTIDDYHRMAEAGIFAEDDRVELIYGVIREMSPKNRAHVVAATRVFRVFEHGLLGRGGVYMKAPLGLAKLDSEPEPDLVVTDNPNVESYGTETSHPRLVIEVADSSRRHDLGLKSELYAKAEIPEYWVVDLPNRVLVVFRHPDGAYRMREAYEPGSRISPVSWPDFEIEVDALFPTRAPSSPQKILANSPPREHDA